MEQHPLAQWGWDERVATRWRAEARPTWQPARVVRVERDTCRVQTAAGETLVDLGPQRTARPVVGDWVALDKGQTFHGTHVAHVLSRGPSFVRKVAGKRARPQLVTANVDTTLILTALDQDFSLRRMERYLTLAWDAGADAIVVLNKADLCADPQARADAVARVARGAPVLTMTATRGEGVAALLERLTPGRTFALLGSSGVGKSTLVNALMERDATRVAEVRADGKGRHTTTQREMFRLPCGALLVDNPGMRELALWADAQAVAHAFDDVEQVARSCRFSDCRHQGEEGCAVVAAVAAGRLDPARVASFTRLRDEAEALARRQRERERREAGGQGRRASAGRRRRGGRR